MVGRRRTALLGALAALAVVLLPVAPAGAAVPPAGATPDQFDATVAAITALDYQSAYVPAGTDSAFPGTVPNTAPVEDYTTGSIPGDPDSPDFPPAFRDVVIISPDGAKLTGKLALQPGNHPAIVVAHGFNTNGKRSVVRWAAMLAANGYNVLAADQRDFAAEEAAGYGYPAYPQTFGWKEAQDILAAGHFLAGQPGVTSVGLVGFSEGAQNTILALSRDSDHVFAAGLAYSPPADQDTQIYRSGTGPQPPGCSGTGCSYPVTGALVTLVTPPYTYTDPCPALDYAAKTYATTPYDILTREAAFHAQQQVSVPLLAVYSADDSLVPAFEAGMTAGYQMGAPLQRTIELQHGEHAYYYDRWWQQQATLTYFKRLLPGATDDAALTTSATVNQTPGGTPLSGQLVDLSGATRASADAEVSPFICDTNRAAPALAGPAPDPVVPEVPVAVLLPLLGIAAAGWAVRRQRAVR